jgi:S-adenosylmethionine:tRNA ribosyltransferase-isomerase
MVDRAIVPQYIGLPGVMKVSDFDFDLPDELIAQEAPPRGTSRLLILDRASGSRRHGSIADLSSVLCAGDLLVVNNTRVFPARLLGRRVPSGGAVECLILGPAAGGMPGSVPPLPDRARGSSDSSSRLCDALVHPGQKLKPGSLVRFEGPGGVLMAEILARRFQGRRTIRLYAESGGEIDALIDALGHIPLPPYIKRPDTAADRERYQTVFARVRGSVAAPTAGLHFSPEVLAALDRSGVERAEVTLHVGYGTFKPVHAEQVEDHVVDPEPYEIPAATAAAMARARGEGRRVIAVGTTTTRALEQAAAAGGGPVAPGRGTATLFVYPGHQFLAIDGLLTNFHLPSSSLLMLVSAFAGRERLLEAYQDAVARGYRFYSYGDAMLIL